MKFPCKAHFFLSAEFGFGDDPVEVDVLTELHEEGMYMVRVPAAIIQAATQDNSGGRASWFDADGSMVMSVASDWLKFAK